MVASLPLRSFEARLPSQARYLDIIFGLQWFAQHFSIAFPRAPDRDTTYHHLSSQCHNLQTGRSTGMVDVPYLSAELGVVTQSSWKCGRTRSQSSSWELYASCWARKYNRRTVHSKDCRRNISHS
jgi:hypothetical protein